MSTTNAERIQNHAAFIWSVADLLRGDFKQSQYSSDLEGRVTHGAAIGAQPW